MADITEGQNYQLQMQKLTAENSELRGTAHQCNEALKAACAAILSLKSQQDAERMEHRRYNNKARDEVTRLQRLVEETQQQLKLEMQKQAELCTKLSERESEIERLRSDRSSLQRRLQEAEAVYNLEVCSLRSHVAEQEAALKCKEDIIGELRQTVDACGNENNSLSDNMMYLRQRFDELLDIGDTLSAKNSSLKDNLRLAVAETRSLKETLAERDEKIRRLERLADEYRSCQLQNCSKNGSCSSADVTHNE